MSSLKDGSSPDIKQKHYQNVIESMMAALNSTLDQEKEPIEDELDAIDKNGYKFRTNVGWEHTIQQPKKFGKVIEGIEEELRFMKVEQRAHHEIHRAAHRTVLKNLYKTYYDVPNDMAVRKADATMKTIVDTSATLKRVHLPGT